MAEEEAPPPRRGSGPGRLLSAMVAGFAVLSLGAPLAAAVSVLTWPPLNCSRQDLTCDVITSNCLDSGWIKGNKYTPASPEDLRVSVDTRRDGDGHLHPVLNASWKIRDDGSISHLDATELQVLTMSNQNLCVRYVFGDLLRMRSPSREKWLFSASMVALDPGQRYRVSVFNIPKPEPGHSTYDVSADVVVPGCQDARMQVTQFCTDRGSLWRPNISLSRTDGAAGRPALSVSFSPDRRCEEYMIIAQCSRFPQHVERAHGANQTSLSVTFSLDKWPTSCCSFDVQIKPLFPECGQDCTRRRKTIDICPVTTACCPAAPPYTFIFLGVIAACAVAAVITYVACRKPGQTVEAAAAAGGAKPPPPPPPLLLQQAPKVLVIYSQDHRLYRDIVLKLCAFLQAKCGTKVLVDLLDSATVGVVGRLRWLEWQRRRLKNPSDKILVLCSRGVQAKWRALCGQGQVTLREDVLSPTDDMLTPFLHLFLPDMYQAGALGKYLVAYFEDVSGEEDVPSVFDITVKYKLMKHFEELYFSILDIEKYQPGQVNHLEGIGRDEYFSCPSGRDLKSAIETFRAHQLENPDWFEKECVDGEEEEEVVGESDALIERLNVPPVLQCVPVIRDGPPVYVTQVEVTENGRSVHVLTPEVNPWAAAAEPRVDHRPSHPGPESVYVVEPVLNQPPPPGQNFLFLQGQTPTEDDEMDSAPLTGRGSARPDASPPPHLLHLNPPRSFPPSEAGRRRRPPAEADEDAVLESGGKAANSGSDQGYGSKTSSRPELPLEEDPLAALARLQEELFQQNTGPEEN